jgi:hypothetical protein
MLHNVSVKIRSRNHGATTAFFEGLSTTAEIGCRIGAFGEATVMQTYTFPAGLLEGGYLPFYVNLIIEASEKDARALHKFVSEVVEDYCATVMKRDIEENGEATVIPSMMELDSRPAKTYEDRGAIEADIMAEVERLTAPPLEVVELDEDEREKLLAGYQ